MVKIEYIIVTGIIMGTLARLFLLRVDYRQYPSYPQGYVIHLTIGMIAAALGAVAIPALIKEEYTAVTFLALAIQQFREIRSMERESLSRNEETELVKRGTAYIEDIAKNFESRNYVALITALSCSLLIYLSKSIIIGVLSGTIVLYLFSKIMYKRTIGDIATVEQTEIEFEGSLLKVHDIIFSNIALKEARIKIKNDGLAVLIKPKDDNAVTTLANLGQRQAILHDVSIQLSIRKENDEPEFTPLAKRNPDKGYIALFLLAREPDIEPLIEAVKRVPVLESTKRFPLQSKAGKMAAD